MDLLCGSNCCGLFFVPLVSASFVEGLGKLGLCLGFGLFSRGLRELEFDPTACEEVFAWNDFTQKILSQGNLEPDVRLPVWQNTRSQIT